MKVERVQLGDVLELQRRRVMVQLDAPYTQVGLRSFGKGVFHKKPVLGRELGEKRVFEVHPGDLLVSNVFGWEGAVAVAGQDEYGLVGSHRFMTWTVAASGVDATYVKEYLLSDEGLEALRRSSPGSAGRNRTLSVEGFRSISVPLPALPEQYRISAQLARVDGIRARRLLGTEDTSAVDALWQALAVGEPVPLHHILARRQEVEPVDEEEHYSFLGMRWYGGGPFVREIVKGRDLRARQVFRVRTGDVIYNRLFAWKGSFGVVDESLDGSVVSNEFPTFTVDRTAIEPSFVRLCLEQPSLWRTAEGLSTGSTPTSRNRLKESEFLNMEIQVPDPSVQAWAIARASLLRSLAEHRRRSVDLAQALLPATRNEIFSRFR